MNSAKYNALVALGFSGALTDMEKAFFISKGAVGGTIDELRYDYFKSIRLGTGISIVDIINSVLTAAGYTGSIDDKTNQALIANNYYV